MIIRLTSWPKRLAAALLSGLMLLFVVNLHPWWPLAWFAPVPILLATFEASAVEAILLSLFATGIGLSSLASYYRLLAPGWWPVVIVIALQACVWAAIIWLTRRFVIQRKWWAVFIYPTLWAAFDTLNTALSPHSSWGSLAYTQGDFAPVLQIAAFTGAPGIVFTISLFASVAAIGLYRGWNGPLPILTYGLPVAMLAAVFVFGQARLATARSTTSITAGIAAIDDPVPAVPREEKSDLIWHSYDDAVADLAAHGAKLIVLPEKIEILDSGSTVSERLALLAAAAHNNAVHITAGAGYRENQVLRNRAWFFDPSGDVVRTYDKHHMVPGLEAAFTPSKEYAVETIDGVRYGLAICKDMHFPSFGRVYGRMGAQAVLVPAWDFDRDAWMAARITALRGVESGFSVIRASRQGLLTVSDPFGRMIAETGSRPVPGASLLADVPLSPAKTTFYARYGDVFGWLCAALALGLCLPWKLIASKSRLALRRPSV